MTISVSDLKIMASAMMVDTADGGGAMSGATLQDGADNNVFLDWASTDRAFGELALRKIYPTVLSPGTDVLLGANVILDDMPDDANTTAWMTAGASSAETRSGLVARLQMSHWVPLGAGGTGVLVWASPTKLTGTLASYAVAGTVVYSLDGTGDFTDPVLILTAASDGAGGYNVTYDGPAPAVGAAYFGVPAPGAPRIASTFAVSGALAVGATFADVPSLLVPVVPKHLGLDAGASQQIGIDPTLILPAGVAVGVHRGDGLVVHHDAETLPAAAVAGVAISCGRGNLTSVRVIGADGAGILSGWTADLAAGTVTPTSVAGWSQPVKVRHTIDEVVACSRTGYPELPATAAAGAIVSSSGSTVLVDGLSIYCGRPGVAALRVYSKTGQDITKLTFLNGVTPPYATVRWWQLDTDAGVATFHAGGAVPMDTTVAAFIASHSPVTVVGTGMSTGDAVPSAPQANPARITFNRPLTRAFPAGARVSTMLLLGDLQALAGLAFSQQTWTSVWSDSRIGDAIVPQYQQLAHPIEVRNDGAITERWALIFTSPSTFRVVGETVGQISVGDINSDTSPVNAGTGQPYWTLRATGWGSGWSAGNVLRFATQGASAPLWVARVTLPSAPTDAGDSLTVAFRGDIDT